MKITKVTAHLMGVPGPGGHGPSRNWVFVRVETDAGITGVGEATTEYHEHAVAAMSCFRNGNPRKSSYRKFRIRYGGGQDDGVEEFGGVGRMERGVQALDRRKT